MTNASENTTESAPKVKAERIDVANLPYVAKELGIQIPAVRQLIHKGKLILQTISMPDFGIFDQSVVTPESVAAYKLAQATKTPGTRGGGRSRTTVSYKMSINKDQLDTVLAALESQFGIVAVPASAPRKAKNTESAVENTESAVA